LFGGIFVGAQQGGDFTQLASIVLNGFPALTRVPLWLQSPLWTKPSFILLLVWSCGTMMLIFLAALRNVPPELHEAAEVDGASAVQRFRHITLALISHLLQRRGRHHRHVAAVRAALRADPRPANCPATGLFRRLLPVVGDLQVQRHGVWHGN